MPSNDYNIYTIKLSLFLLSFALYFSVNGFFFSDETMHKVYEAKGSFNLLTHLPKIFYSTLVSSFINIILNRLSLSEKDIIKIKGQEDILKARENSKKIELCFFSLLY